MRIGDKTLRKVTVILLISLIMLILTPVIFDMDKLDKIHREVDEWWAGIGTDNPENIDTGYSLTYMFYMIIFCVLAFVSFMIFIIGYERKDMI